MSEPTTRIDRLPPHSLEAEQGVLGCCLLAQDALLAAINVLRAGPLEFYDLRHRTVYEALLGLFNDRVPVDMITLRQDLTDQLLMEQAGGMPYVAELPDLVPSAANIQFYLDIVHDKYVLRRLIGSCTEIVGRAYEEQGDVAELLDQAETAIHSVVDNAQMQGTCFRASELVGPAQETIERLHHNRGALTGLATGFIDYDRITGGLQEGDVVLLAGRPGYGKTAYAMNVAVHVSSALQVPVAFFSLEMTADALMLRALCATARVDMSHVKDGFLTEHDFSRLTAAVSQLHQAPLFIDEASGISILQLRAKARRMHSEHGIGLFVVDYLQLLHASSRKAENRQQEVAEISGGLKSMAKELRVPVIVLAQLNREVEKRGPGARPRMSELRESGSLEADADVVGLLFKPSTEEEDEPARADALAVTLALVKHRHGRTGDIHLTFIRGYTRFESASRISDRDVPEEPPGRQPPSLPIQ